MHVNVEKMSYGFEQALSYRSGDLLRLEYTMMANVFYRTLQVCFGWENLAIRHDLWTDLAKKRYEGDHESHGLNFKHQMEVYGYAWFPDKFNWQQWTFQPEYMMYNLFVTSNLQKSYRKRWKEVEQVSGAFLDLQKMWVIFNEIKKTESPTFEELFLDACDAFLMNVFRRHVFQIRKEHWQGLSESLNEEQLDMMKDAQRGLLPMDEAYFNLFTANYTDEERKVASGTGIERKTGREHSTDVEFRVRWLWDWENTEG